MQTFNSSFQPWFKGIPSGGFKRIVSLVPSQTELLFYLGAGNYIIGVTKFCIHPNEAKELAKIIGGTKTIHFDRIEALQPDLIIANKEENTQEIIETLGSNYNLWCTDIISVEDALSAIHDLALLVSEIEKGAELVQKIKLTIPQVIPFEKPKVAYLIWNDPIMVAAIGTFINSILEAGGFTNVFQSLVRYPEISIDELKTANPDFVFLSSEPYPFKEKHIAELQTYLPEAKIILVDGELFSWYGNRLLLTFHYIEALKQSLALA
jgi:ABC-type Fe3+-hydroxamate transport system substrate-binding protein